MKIKYLMLVAVALLAASCSKKKETNTIITTIEKPAVSKEVKKVGDGTTKNDFQWSGDQYYATITRKALTDAPTVKDADGQKYYDNSVTLNIEGPNGNVLNKTFTKEDFSSYINTNYMKPSRSTLVAIKFDKVDGANAVFIATIGSPCDMDDEYMLVRISIYKDGGMSMKTIQIAE